MKSYLMYIVPLRAFLIRQRTLYCLLLTELDWAKIHLFHQIHIGFRLGDAAAILMSFDILTGAIIIDGHEMAFGMKIYHAIRKEEARATSYAMTSYHQYLSVW